MALFDVLSSYFINKKKLDNPEQPEEEQSILGMLGDIGTSLPKKVLNTVIGSAEASPLPPVSQDKMAQNIIEENEVNQPKNKTSQEAMIGELGGYNSDTDNNPSFVEGGIFGQPVQNKNKWDKILDAIQVGSGLLHTVGGDNLALAQSRQAIQPKQKPTNELEIARLREQMRHNREIEGIGRTRANKQGGEDLKTLTTSAVEKISDSDRAISELGDLGDKLNKNVEAVGVISGLRKYNPWDAQALSLQADIDRVRQLVGRALEGGVLRKEDEQKYKKILAEITDDPKVARYKIKEITRDMEKNRENTLSNFGRAGYKTSGFESKPEKKVSSSSQKRRRYNPETGNFEEI